MADVLKHEEYPKWLNHPHEQKLTNKFSPVLVYNEDDEQYYRAQGYEPPGKSDPHAYIVAKATEKLDGLVSALYDTVNKKIEREVELRLNDAIHNYMIDFVRRYKLGMDNGRKLYLGYEMDDDDPDANAETESGGEAANQLEIEQQSESDVNARVADQFSEIFHNIRKLRETGGS